MPRRNRARRDAPRPARPAGWGSVETGSDGEWIVRPVAGSQATKSYRCPGCDHEIREGTPHVVCWPADDTGGVADRRHWHRGCWDARERRWPTRRR